MAGTIKRIKKLKNTTGDMFTLPVNVEEW